MSDLFHDGAMCPECEERTGTPNLVEGDDPSRVPPCNVAAYMRCAVCGHEWRADDIAEIARAWFAHGAYQQHLREQETRDKLATDLKVTQAAVRALSRTRVE